MICNNNKCSKYREVVKKKEVLERKTCPECGEQLYAIGPWCKITLEFITGPWKSIEFTSAWHWERVNGFIKIRTVVAGPSGYEVEYFPINNILRIVEDMAPQPYNVGCGVNIEVGV